MKIIEYRNRNHYQKRWHTVPSKWISDPELAWDNYYFKIDNIIYKKQSQKLEFMDILTKIQIWEKLND